MVSAAVSSIPGPGADNNVQRYSSLSPSTSVEPEPSSNTVAPTSTVLSRPASASGGRFSAPSSSSASSSEPGSSSVGGGSEAGGGTTGGEEGGGVEPPPPPPQAVSRIPSAKGTTRRRAVFKHVPRTRRRDRRTRPLQRMADIPQHRRATGADSRLSPAENSGAAAPLLILIVRRSTSLYRPIFSPSSISP